MSKRGQGEFGMLHQRHACAGQVLQAPPGQLSLCEVPQLCHRCSKVVALRVGKCLQAPVFAGISL